MIKLPYIRWNFVQMLRTYQYDTYAQNFEVSKMFVFTQYKKYVILYNIFKKTMKGTSVNGSNYCTPNAIFLYFTHLETLNAVSDVSHDLTL